MPKIAGSFRDPSGYVYVEEGEIFRAINLSYKDHYEYFISSGLCHALISEKLLIAFDDHQDSRKSAWKVIKPTFIPFISFPFEWSFSQYKEAALATLEIQLLALKHGMTLKDASAYNIQFFQGQPVLIDHLSFETLIDGQPWSAYRQFVMHFLAPLTLMAKVDLRHSFQLKNFIDGVPLDYASKHLPTTSWMDSSTLMHIHLHAKLQKKYSDTKSDTVKNERKKIKSGLNSSQAIINLIESLKKAIKKLSLPKLETEWGSYYKDTNYTDVAFSFKKDTVLKIAEKIKPRVACDLGANNGEFSLLLSNYSQYVISADIDPLAVNKNYLRNIKNKKIIPLIQDLCNPSPSIGWANAERPSFIERAKCDFVMGLALVHHLCIGNNVPLEYVAEFFSSIAPVSLIEFVPKCDSQVQRLLSSREDIFHDYSIEKCIEAFKLYYNEIEIFQLPETSRSLLLFSGRK